MIDQDVVGRNGRQRNAVLGCERMTEVVGLDFLHGNGLGTDLLSHCDAVARQRNGAGSRTADPFGSPLGDEIVACGEAAGCHHDCLGINSVAAGIGLYFGANDFAVFHDQIDDLAVQAVSNFVVCDSL